MKIFFCVKVLSKLITSTCIFFRTHYTDSLETEKDHCFSCVSTLVARFRMQDCLFLQFLFWRFYNYCINIFSLIWEKDTIGIRKVKTKSSLKWFIFFGIKYPFNFVNKQGRKLILILIYFCNQNFIIHYI